MIPNDTTSFTRRIRCCQSLQTVLYPYLLHSWVIASSEVTSLRRGEKTESHGYNESPSIDLSIALTASYIVFMEISTTTSQGDYGNSSKASYLYL